MESIGCYQLICQKFCLSIECVRPLGIAASAGAASVGHIPNRCHANCQLKRQPSVPAAEHRIISPLPRAGGNDLDHNIYVFSILARRRDSQGNKRVAVAPSTSPPYLTPCPHLFSFFKYPVAVCCLIAKRII